MEVFFGTRNMDGHCLRAVAPTHACAVDVRALLPPLVCTRKMNGRCFWYQENRWTLFVVPGKYMDMVCALSLPTRVCAIDVRALLFPLVCTGKIDGHSFWYQQHR